MNGVILFLGIWLLPVVFMFKLSVSNLFDFRDNITAQMTVVFLSGFWLFLIGPALAIVAVTS